MLTTPMTNETPAQARAYDEARDRYATEGLCNPCASRAAHLEHLPLSLAGTATSHPTAGCKPCEKVGTEQGRKVLREVTGWTDWTLSRDLGSALAEVPTEADRKALRAYLALRRRADDWRPNRVPARSNHGRVNRAELAELTNGTTGTKPCAHCGERFRLSGRATYCGDVCARAARRTRERERRAA